MFKTSEENTRPGFAMTFDNGWTISIQWHQGAYCDGRYNNDGSSENAEIAMWDKEGNWYDFGGDSVKGYCSTDEVLDWMYKCSRFGVEPSIQEKGLIKIQ